MLELPTDESRPQRVVLESRADLAQAVLVVLRRARRELRCLHHDLSVFELAQPAAVEVLHAFLHDSRMARLRLLVDETDWLETRAARLRVLHRQLSHAIEMRRAITDDPVGEDAALVADDAHVLVLSRSAQGLGEIWFNSQPRAQPLLLGFDRRWDAGAHNLPVDPLGL
ncbi:MAG TPA: hypothetical protein VMG60_14345 [Burkholderiaceae bacterium]|nr:hypothetical protein [Burkholderiaceae bacterium]